MVCWAMSIYSINGLCTSIVDAYKLKSFWEMSSVLEILYTAGLTLNNYVVYKLETLETH